VKYQPPYGQPDPNAPYVNGNPAQGIEGSIPPAAAFEQNQRELVGLIQNSGLTPLDADLTQVTQGVRSQFLNFAQDTGTANNLVVALDPPLIGTNYSPGLTLRVRVAATNTGPCNINAGLGVRGVRKMSGADVGPNELPINSIATLVFDGTNFQLSNFGGGGGGTGDVYEVNIPYTQDISITPGTITANFTPAIPPMQPGNVIAVRIANTSPGATSMTIDAQGSFLLQPNGCARPEDMLQGDVIAGDVVQFFYDGNALRFPPNPEINAPVIYSVGPSQQFDTIDDAMGALKRKTIGQDGYVTLQMIIGNFPGQINVAHPSGDRITIRGTMISGQARPQWNDFQANGSSQAQRAIDATANLNMLVTKFGTRIMVANNGGATGDYGVQNSGAGRITFADLLITPTSGTPPALGPNNETWQIGVYVPQGSAARCNNVSIWGCQGGFNAAGGLNCADCYACACANYGHAVSGSLVATGSGVGGPGGYGGGGSFGNGAYGVYALSAKVTLFDQWVCANGAFGIAPGGGSGVETSWGRTVGNPWDMYAQQITSIVIGLPSTYGTTFPLVDSGVNNTGSSISTFSKLRPPPVGASAASAGEFFDIGPVSVPAPAQFAAP
jgi:hypothetical protein